jgi:hypothetical protein
MTEQTKAERLADSAHLGYRVGWQRETAAELRRLSAVNAGLLEALKACLDWMETLRISGDAGNWQWKEDEYTAGCQAIARAEE